MISINKDQHVEIGGRNGERIGNEKCADPERDSGLNREVDGKT